MPHPSPSALITDKGKRVLLRIQGRHFECNQTELRNVLGLPAGPPGLGITIEGDRLHFEFAGDDQEIKITAAQLKRRFAKRASVETKAST